MFFEKAKTFGKVDTPSYSEMVEEVNFKLETVKDDILKEMEELLIVVDSLR